MSLHPGAVQFWRTNLIYPEGMWHYWHSHRTANAGSRLLRSETPLLTRIDLEVRWRANIYISIANKETHAPRASYTSG